MNLVPFIDLLSCCLAFLLITAAWSQLGRLPATSAGGATDESANPAPPSSTLFVNSDDLTLVDAAGTTHRLKQPELLAALRVTARDSPSLRIRATDTVRMTRVVDALDAAHGAGFAHVEVGYID
ncbi:MAG TPA: biopolymer transporter ExbD [Kofleriaceae bacterium]|nr:biopolymer transporter ExbD [Kofleriaceae bacterium]